MKNPDPHTIPTSTAAPRGLVTLPARRLLVTLLIALTIYGCAAEKLHDEGMELYDHGQTLEGLGKLEAAVKADPSNIPFRKDLVQKREQLVTRLLRGADNERSGGRFDTAEELYRSVLGIDPGNARATAGLENIQRDRRHAAALVKAQALFDKQDLQGAQRILKAILLENPNQSGAKLLQRQIEEQTVKDAMAGPTLSSHFKKPVTLQFRDANLRMVVEALSRSSGINILLDKDVRPDLKTTIFVKDASVEDTIDLILLQNQLLKKVLSDNTIFIYPNNPAKVKEYQDLMIRSFQLTNASAKDMAAMIKTLLKTRDLFVDEKANSLVMRDTPDAVRLAEKMIATQDLPEPEVMLEVEVIEVTRSLLSELGVKLPEQIALSAPGQPAVTTTNALPGGGVVTTTQPAVPLTLETLKNINGSYFNVSELDATINLKDQSGDANILASPRIRVRNREKAKILIGDRVPVITNGVTPVSTGAPVVTGSVQYLDVGLKLDVEPDIHLDDDVAIKMSLEVSNIVGEVTNGPTVAYHLGTRSANTVLRLKDGETQVLAGLISDEDRKSAQKFPGLGDLPVVGRLFSSHRDDGKKTEIILSITPHLTRAAKRPDAQNVEFWSGTEATLRSRPIALQPATTAPAATPAATPSPAAGPVPAPAAIVPVAPAKTPSPATSSGQGAVSPQPLASPQASGVGAPVSPQAPPRGAAAIARAAPDQPVALTWQAPAQVKVGETFKVIVDAQSSAPLGTLSFTLGYDPKTLALVHVSEGDLLKQNGKKAIFTPKVDQSTGHAFLRMEQLGPEGATGKGSVASVTFMARAPVAKAPIVISDPVAVTSNGRKFPPSQTTPLVITLAP